MRITDCGREVLCCAGIPYISVALHQASCLSRAVAWHSEQALMTLALFFLECRALTCAFAERVK